MSLGLPTSDKQNIDLYAGNPDLMYVAHVFENFPAWKDTLQNMISSSLNRFAGNYPNFV